MAVVRLCRGEDPLITRICRGVYTRRRVNARYPARLPIKAIRALALAVRWSRRWGHRTLCHQHVRLEHSGVAAFMGGYVGETTSMP